VVVVLALIGQDDVIWLRRQVERVHCVVPHDRLHNLRQW
jgi:hypothetical protein